MLTELLEAKERDEMFFSSSAGAFFFLHQYRKTSRGNKKKKTNEVSQHTACMQMIYLEREKKKLYISFQKITTL
jgi:hypothetical protein